MSGVEEIWIERVELAFEADPHSRILLEMPYEGTQAAMVNALDAATEVGALPEGLKAVSLRYSLHQFPESLAAMESKGGDK